MLDHPNARRGRNGAAPTLLGLYGVKSNERMTLRPIFGAADYPTLVQIWRSAVDATHDFLAAEDRKRIEENLIPHYFPAVELFAAELDGELVGFAGVAEGTVEMLFIASDYHGRGIGTALLDEAVSRHGARTVDVNEHNPGAVGFYRSYGFVITGRDETDADGRPYPILHMRLDLEPQL